MAGCQHHWVLASPREARIEGRCKKCELQRSFPARLEDTDRGNDYLELSGAGGGASGWGVRAA